MESNKIALITGATSGIGKATATLLAQHGYNVIACGRREDRLLELKDQLDTEVLPLVFDIRDRAAVMEILTTIPESWKAIDVLVNNAGNAHGLSPIQSGNVDDWEAMIDINVKGLLYVSRTIIPGMVERGRGHVVNIGSIAGKEVYANGNVYCASKYAVDALNQGMRMDLNKEGIRVTAINPGLVETEFSIVRFKGDKERSKKVYNGYKPLYPEDIAELVHYVISAPPHVMIADLTVFPTAQASATIVNRS